MVLTTNHHHVRSGLHVALRRSGVTSLRGIEYLLHRAVFGWFDSKERRVVTLPEKIRQVCLLDFEQTQTVSR